MTDQPIYVDNELFLGRLDEQERFRETLHTVLTSRDDDAPPFIFLLHGEGGMGKSQLTRRLYDIAAAEAPFERDCYALRVDWEIIRNNTPALRVAREQIHPEEVLAALHRQALDAGWGKQFEAYHQVIRQREQAEQEIARALEQQEESSQYIAIRDLGATGLAKLIRLALPVGQTGEELSRALLTAGIQLGAEQAAKAREQAERLLKARLKPELTEVYRQPHEQLARALGHGFRQVSHGRPLVLLLDTYEIVAGADAWLRVTMDVAGPRVVWLIAGRDNLAASRPNDRYVGYSAEFPRRLTVWDTQELAIEYVEAYLRNRAPARPPLRAEAVAIHQATWGVPLALRQAADLWEKGLPLAAITEGLPDHAPREELVRLMCERVLLHVEQDTAGEADRRALYALAMQPRPDAEIQAAIMRLVDGIFDLHTRLAELARRYSVVRLAGGARLHEKMGEFVHEYLLRTEASASEMIKHIAGRAIETLRLRRARLEEDLFDLAERVESEDWQQTTLDLVDWLFWQDERAAWRELVPRFVEGLGYNRDFAESLLVVANNFELKLSKDGRKRLKQLQLAEDNRDTMLTELERLAQKGRWLDDDDAEATAERQTILLLWRGHWQAGQGQLNQALQTYLAAESHLPKQATNLRLQLGQGFNHLSQKFIWPQGREFWSIPSEPGLQAAQRAVTLNPENKSAWFRFGLALIGQRDPQQALAVFQQGIQISPEEGSLWRGQGVAYRDLGQYEETIQSLRRALELNPRDATAWFHLGSVSRILDRYEEAIEAYQQAINLGHPRLVSDSQRNLSYLYRDLGRYDEAIEICQQGVELNPKAASLHIALGGLYELKENLEEALQHYRQAVELQPDNGTGHASLALGLRQLGREIEAAEHLARARELMAKEDDYNKACIEAIIGDTEAALDHLTLAFAQRPRLRNWAQRDPDLASLHGHPRFEALVGNEGGP